MRYTILVFAGAAAAAISVWPASATMRITNDRGGRLTVYAERFEAACASGERVIIMSDERRKLPPEGGPSDVLVPRPVVAPKAETSGSWTKETRPKSHRPAQLRE